MYHPSDWPSDKASLYRLLAIRLQGLIDGVPHLTANLANASALLMDALTDINWAGFYLIEKNEEKKDRLVLGPFQGKPACIEIEIGKGVCGSAVSADSVMLVKNVHEFPGHIACDGASNSEIVLPIHGACTDFSSFDSEDNTSSNRTVRPVIGVLDIDSPLLARFDEEDQAGLARFVEILETAF